MASSFEDDFFVVRQQFNKVSFTGHGKKKDRDGRLALRDVLETERLEPQNTGIRKQERLQSDKMEVSAGVNDQKTSDVLIAECTEQAGEKAGELCTQNEETFLTYWHLCDEIRRKHGVKIWHDVSKESLLCNISVLYKGYQKLMEKYCEWIERWRNMTETEAEQRLSDRVESLYGELLVDRICGGDNDMWRQRLGEVSVGYGSCGRWVTYVRDLEDNYQSYVQQHCVQRVMDEYRECRSWLENMRWVVARRTLVNCCVTHLFMC